MNTYCCSNKPVLQRPVESIQYSSQQLAEVAGDLDLLRSMGRTGVCWDNALAEAFWSTFKNEYYHRHTFATIEQARRGSYTWIDAWYNAHRRHSKIGYISPLQDSVVEVEVTHSG